MGMTRGAGSSDRRRQAAAQRARRLVACWGMVAMLLLPGVAAAQSGPTNGESPEPLGTTPTPAVATSPPATPVPVSVDARGGISFRTLGYGDQTAQAADGSLSYMLPLPPNSLPDSGSTLHLVLSHSPLLLPDLSTLTVLVNGQRLTSVFLTRENAVRGLLSVPLETTSLGPGGYLVQLQFSLALSHDECAVPDNPGLWATIHDDSSIVLRLRPDPNPLGLEQLDRLLTPSGPAPPPMAMVLPKNPLPAELEAAGLVAFQIGRWAAAAGASPAVEIFAADQVPLDRPVILVGTGRALKPVGSWGGLSWAGTSYTTGERRIPTNQGIVALAPDGGRGVLVSGGTPGAVLDAADALARPERRAQLAGERVILTSRDTTRVVAPVAWSDGAASFAQLGATRLEVNGSGEHTLDLGFERPAEWILTDGGNLDLVVTTTTGIRDATSWIAVSVNGHDLGAIPVKDGNREGGHYRFPLPTELLNGDLNDQPVRRLALQIRIFLDLPAGACIDRATEREWAAVALTSVWNLPHDRYPGLDLGRFPAPLLEANTAAPLDVVLPRRPTPAEVAAAMGVAAALGRWTGPERTALPRLMTSDHLSSDERSEDHLILIGGADRNEVAKAAAARDAPSVAPVKPTAYQQVPADNAGWLRLAPSPWADDRGLLTIGGSRIGGLDRAVAALTTAATIAQLRGTAASVAGTLPPQSQAAAAPAPVAPAELAPRAVTLLPPRDDRRPAWQITSALLLGVVIGALALWGARFLARRGRAARER
jgi:hypothetical protein